MRDTDEEKETEVRQSFTERILFISEGPPLCIHPLSPAAKRPKILGLCQAFELTFFKI